MKDSLSIANEFWNVIANKVLSDTNYFNEGTLGKEPKEYA